MTTTALATTRAGNGLALSSDQDWWNDKQLAALRQLGVDRASNGDLAVFMHVAQKTGLDPFARQIYLIERQGKQTIQTGIDGFRLVARRAVDRAKETLAIGGGEWCGKDGQWRDVWLEDGPPAAARVTVIRGGQSFVGIALWREYAQTKRDGGLTSMWAQRSAGQLAKCAEALALRKAFPMDLAGIYTDDELGHADRSGRQEPPSNSGTGRDRIAAVLDRPGPNDTPEDQRPGTEPSGDGTDDDAVDAVIVEDSPRLDMRSALAKKLFATLNDAGILDEQQHEYLGDKLGRPIASRKDLTEGDARKVIDLTEEALENPWGNQPAEGGAR